MKTVLVGMSGDDVTGCLVFDSVNQAIDWLNDGCIAAESERRLVQHSSVFVVVATSGMAFQVERLGKAYCLIRAHGAVPPEQIVRPAAPKQYELEHV